MNEQANLMMLVWESLDEFITPGDKQEAANSLVKSFIEFHDIDELYDADGTCPFIDSALEDHQLVDEEAEPEED